MDSERPDGRHCPLSLPTFNLSRVQTALNQVGELREQHFSDLLAT
jgi:hypothetical protein